MTIDERLAALTMNLELTARRIEDFGQRTEQAAALAQMELRDLRDSVNTLAAGTAQLLKVAEHTDLKLNEHRIQADAERKDFGDRTARLLKIAEMHDRRIDLLERRSA